MPSLNPADYLNITKKKDPPDNTADLVTGTARRYRREFNDPALTSWNVTTGAGMTVAVAGGALTVATGTTANSVTTLTTKESFTVPFKASMGFKISQKAANQEFYAEVVAVNDDKTVDETAVAAWRVAHADSSTTTVARVETRNGAAARSQSGNLTGFTQTTDGIFDIVVDSEEAQFHCRAVDSASGRTVSAVRNSVAPDPGRRYALRYRIVNLGTAPASSTTFTSQFVTCVDYTEIQAEITSGGGQSSNALSVPVLVNGGSVTATVSSTTVAASSTATGVTVAKVLSAATTNATLVKNAAARVYGYRFANTNTTAFRYVKFYNSTSAPTVGTTAPLYTVAVAPNSTADAQFTIPISHATGLGYAITAGPTDNDTAAVAAAEVSGHILYV